MHLFIFWISLLLKTNWSVSHLQKLHIKQPQNIIIKIVNPNLIAKSIKLNLSSMTSLVIISPRRSSQSSLSPPSKGQEHSLYFLVSQNPWQMQPDSLPRMGRNCWETRSQDSQVPSEVFHCAVLLNFFFIDYN